MASTSISSSPYPEIHSALTSYQTDSQNSKLATVRIEVLRSHRETIRNAYNSAIKTQESNPYEMTCLERGRTKWLREITSCIESRQKHIFRNSVLYENTVLHTYILTFLSPSEMSRYKNISRRVRVLAEDAIKIQLRYKKRLDEREFADYLDAIQQPNPSSVAEAEKSLKSLFDLCPNLRSLALPIVRINGAARSMNWVEILANACPGLTSLDIRSVHSVDLCNFATTHTCLRSLKGYLSQLIEYSDLPYIFPTLKKLEVDWVGFLRREDLERFMQGDYIRAARGGWSSDEHLLALTTNCPHLKRLTLQISQDISGDSFVTMIHQAASLKSLNLDLGAATFSASYFKDSLRLLPTLRSLTIRNSQHFDEQGLSILVTVCTQLKKISLIDCPNLRGRDICTFVRKLMCLKKLTLKRVPSLSDKMTVALAAESRTLKQIKLIECPNVSRKIAKKIHYYRPDVRIIYKILGGNHG